jgi:hypothetical protein
VTRIPDLDRCPQARAIVESPEFQAEASRFGSEPLVDYRGVMALKRRVLEELARSIGSDSLGRSGSFRRYIETHPAAEDYAAFRAKVERDGTPWNHWPSPQRDGTLSAADYDESIKQYHLYVQWQANEQVERVNQKAQVGGAALYLDFPLVLIVMATTCGASAKRLRQQPPAAHHRIYFHQRSKLGISTAASGVDRAGWLWILHPLSSSSFKMCGNAAHRSCDGLASAVLDSRRV